MSFASSSSVFICVHRWFNCMAPAHGVFDMRALLLGFLAWGGTFAALAAMGPAVTVFEAFSAYHHISVVD